MNARQLACACTRSAGLLQRTKGVGRIDWQADRLCLSLALQVAEVAAKIIRRTASGSVRAGTAPGLMRCSSVGRPRAPAQQQQQKRWVDGESRKFNVLLLRCHLPR